MENGNARGFGRTVQGIVASNKMDKTITVEVTRTVRHPRYNKFVKENNRFHAHDKNNECDIGDSVIIVEAKPLSKMKRWRLQRIVEKVTR